MSSVKDNPYAIVRRPVITEKTAHVSAHSCVVFEVHPDANKYEVKGAIEKIFDVKVKAVRLVNVLGKERRNEALKRDIRKKAYITLADGSALNVIEGL
ncbi:50S ribosomal protein L23 [bacterium]|nr:50S ribosomal protein L23 [bacterium]